MLTMSTHRCEECRAVLDPAKVLRCTKCKACFYCSAACQKRNWRLHKRVCSTDPLARRLVPVEMAIERALKIQPKMEQAPKDAFCYICLDGDGDGKSSKLMRGCACRGDSAGFVHLDCLTELAKSKEASGDFQAIYDSWYKCGTCKQGFQGALNLEMSRRFWRRYREVSIRSRQELTLRYNSAKMLAICLGQHGEVDAASQLLDEASTFVGNDKGALLELKLLRADILARNGKKLEALGLLQAILPEAKAVTANPHFYTTTLRRLADVLLCVDRIQEAHEAASELVTFAKAKFGLEDPATLRAVRTYAVTCARLGRVEEARANFNDVLTTQTRVLGREHYETQLTRKGMRICGCAAPSG